MNLGIEYLLRNNITENFLKEPCSLFLTSRSTKKRLVVVVDRDNIKHWHLFECLPEQALPPMYNSNQVVPQGEDYKMLNYLEDPIPSQANSWRRPMPRSIYEKHFDSTLSSRRHSSLKQLWLWDSFLKIHHPEAAMEDNVWWPSSGLAALQQKFIKDKFLKSWRYWNMWKKHLLFDENIPGELIFKNL